jgi:hypothetical protein
LLEHVNNFLCPVCLKTGNLKKLKCGCTPCLEDLHIYCEDVFKEIKDKYDCPGSCGETFDRFEINRLLKDTRKERFYQIILDSKDKNLDLKVRGHKNCPDCGIKYWPSLNSKNRNCSCSDPQN